MSHYKEITTHIVSRHHIEAALDDMGITYQSITEREAEIPLYDWLGRKTHLTAEVVVKGRDLTPGETNDLGWAMNDEGVYVAQVDHVDAKTVAVMRGVNQRAALLRLQELAYTNGFNLEMVEDEENVQRVLMVEGR